MFGAIQFKYAPVRGELSLGGGKASINEVRDQINREAVSAIVGAIAVSAGDARTQCIMACGTGKTRVGLRAAEKLADKHLLCMPTLALIAQTLKEYQSLGQKKGMKYLIVCSDDSTVSSTDDDELKIDSSELPAKVTTNVEEIADFLRNADGPVTIMSTFNSLPLVAEAQELKGVPVFDLTTIDEAHKTAASDTDSLFALVHDNQKIKSERRLYLTATPKVYKTDKEVCSMDNWAIFGKVCYSLPFACAVELGILTDYRILMPVITEKELGQSFDRLDRNELATLAVLKAIEEHDIKKIVSFHATVERSIKVADFLNTQEGIWAREINGTMPTSERNKILSYLKEQRKDHVSIVTNCKCLTEGIDIPLLDAVVFYDPRNSEVDIAQALGRAIRIAPGKQHGYFILPLLIKENEDPATFLESSEFRKIAQVIRSISSFDDTFEGKIKSFSGEGGFGKGSESLDSSSTIDIDTNLQIDPELFAAIKTKIVRIGLNLKSDLLSVEKILEAAEAFYLEHGRLPTERSKEPVPGMPNETWNGIDQGAKKNNRGLKDCKSLPAILKPLREKYKIVTTYEKPNLSIEKILEVAEAFYTEHGRLPTVESKEPVPGMSNETWNSIDSAARSNGRGLKDCKSLPEILKPLREKYKIFATHEKPNLSVEKILEVAEAFYSEHGRLPIKVFTERVPGMPNETWNSIDSAARSNGRGLKDCKSLSEILKPLRKKYKIIATHEKPNLSVEKILEVAEAFYSEHGRLPIRASTEPVPGMPHETWNSIDSTARSNGRGLKDCKSLSEILKPLREKYGIVATHEKLHLSIEKILEVAEAFYSEHGRLPTVNSKEPVPGMSDETWSGINQAARNNIRGLKNCKSLCEILKPLKEKYRK